MGRLRNRGRRKKKTKIVVVQAPPQKVHQFRWKLVGLLLTIITGIAMPLYFQHESDQSQLAVMDSLATVQALQSTMTAHLSLPYSSGETSFELFREYNLGGLRVMLPRPFKVPNDVTYIRLIDASPDAGTIDAFVEKTKLLADHTFGTVTDYASVPRGSKLQVVLIGKGVNASVLAEIFETASGVAYTVAVIGGTSTGFALEGFVDQ